MVAPTPTGRERQAAVLVLLFERDGQLNTVLTRRSQHVSGHKGEISFPGGKHDPSDGSLWHTALRECWEEIGIECAGVVRLGELEPVLTVVTNYAIVPFVATIDHPSFVPNALEVDEVIELPLRRLLEPGAVREELWDHDGMPRTIYFYEYGPHVIWGATGRILRQLLYSPFWPLPRP